MIGKFRPHALRLLEQHDIRITFVDVGSRNGVLEIGDLARFVDAYGFEPNPAEYEKLVSGKTDLFLKLGMSSPPYRTLRYFPYAVADFCGRHEFYVTPGPGACGLREPNLARLEEIVWKGESTNVRNFAEEHFADFRTIEVETTTLDTFAAEQAIDHIDYLKIDVEGLEYEVLAGGRSLLPQTAVIKVEVCFIPFRKEQKLFSHVDLLLREHDFDLVRYEIHMGHIGYKERRAPAGYVPAGYADPGGQALSCDAIYVNRGIADPRRALAQAIVLLEKKYVDEALHVLRTRTAVADQELLDALRTFRGGRLRALGHRLVDRSLDAGGHLARFLRR